VRRVLAGLVEIRRLPVQIFLSEEDHKEHLDSRVTASGSWISIHPNDEIAGAEDGAGSSSMN